jgi:hypothetical protein
MQDDPEHVVYKQKMGYSKKCLLVNEDQIVSPVL